MGAGADVGRIGGLAVALGIGAAVVTGHGVASADPAGSSGSESSSTSSSSTDSSPSTGSSSGSSLTSSTLVGALSALCSRPTSFATAAPKPSTHAVSNSWIRQAPLAPAQPQAEDSRGPLLVCWNAEVVEASRVR